MKTLNIFIKLREGTNEIRYYQQQIDDDKYE